MEDEPDNVVLATELTIAWLANPHTRASADEAAAFVASMHQAVEALTGDASPPDETAEPQEYKRAINSRSSLQTVGRIISMIDGKPYASLTRHLKSHGLSPAEYRERYRLKPDYPMVAPAYSEARRAAAKRLWLSRTADNDAAPANEVSEAAPKRRKNVADALKTARAKLGGDLR